MKLSLIFAFLITVVLTKAQIANRYNVLITEIMADPAPQIGLPNNEWIEIRNVSTVAFNIQGWRIGDLSGLSGAMPNFILQPDSTVIICTGSASTAMSAFGRTISVTNFPSLDNDGDQIFLRSVQGRTIHAVEYSSTWYQNELKKDGGWSLEMIDTKNPCSGMMNWLSSIDASGGTPGKRNSVSANNADVNAPALLKSFATDSVTITVVFNETVDSLKGATIANFNISEGIGAPISAQCLPPLFNRTILKLNAPLIKNKVYALTVNNVSDCANNVIGLRNTIRTGWADVPDSLNIIVNEILFNPPSNGSDYVEIYNRSNKIIDLKQLYLANRNTSGVISNLKQLSTESFLIFPDDYFAFTENANWVKQNYLVRNPENLIELISMPSYNDDKGNVVIVNFQGKIMDEVAYNEDWHFKLIDNKEAVSLERIDFNSASSIADNWHSASKSAGYGTPTYRNSQFKADLQVQGDIMITPETFSPDNDGFDDFITINYNFPQPGYVMNITIFDAQGRPVKALQRNALCGSKGYYRWDGLDDKLRKVPVGIYVVLTEVFNLKGNTKKFKNAVVVATKF